MFEQYTLKNNARVVLMPQQDTRSVTALIAFPVGSRYEAEKLSGVSHYIEHLMFKGTKKRKNTLVLTREIDRLGAEYNAFTGKESTAYYIKIDAEYTRTALDILSDMLFNSLFDPKEMEREKGPIIEELRMYKDNPIMRIDSVLESNLFGDSPLGRDIGGTEKHVRSYKRNDVLSYRDKYYVPRNMTIAVAGKMLEQTKGWIEEFFCPSPSVSKFPLNKFLPVKYGSTAKNNRVTVEQKKTDQVQLMLAFPGFQYGAPEIPSATVMDAILGGSMSSRLFIQIRERRGLAYMIRSGDEQFRDTGYLYIRAGLEAKNINKAISVIKQEVEKLKSKGVTPRELADAKTHLHGAVTLSMEDSSAQANWYARQALFMDRVYTPEERLQAIDAVTGEDIKRLACKVYDMSKMRVAVIGDVKAEGVRF